LKGLKKEKVKGKMIEILLSGLIGALLAVIGTIGYTEYRNKRERKLSLAREKLEKVYGPLVALKKKIDLVNQNDGGFLLHSNPAEKEMIENILFHYYHLIDDDLKEGLMLIHPQISGNYINQAKTVQLNVIDKIRQHYKENKEILGIK